MSAETILKVFGDYHFKEYEYAMSFLCRYLYDKKFSKKYPLEVGINFFEFNYDELNINYDGLNNITEISNSIDNSINESIRRGELFEKFMSCNVKLMNKLFKDLVLLIHESMVVIPRKNMRAINTLFNKYYERHNPPSQIWREQKNKKKQVYRQIKDEYSVAFKPNMLWRIYYKRMKILEDRYIYYKCLLRKKIGMAEFCCNMIGENLYPLEDKLSKEEKYEPIK